GELNPAKTGGPVTGPPGRLRARDPGKGRGQQREGPTAHGAEPPLASMICGPATSPLSILRRRASVLGGREPVSTTRTTPQRVSMARRAAVSSAAGTDSAGRHFASVKCTCVFQKPAVTERPAPSSTVAPAGTRTP